MNYRIKFLRTLIGLFVLCSAAASAQDSVEGHANNFSVGYDVGTIANGIANGLRVASPSFFHDRMRIVGSANLGWAQNVRPKDKTDDRWAYYGLYTLGLHSGRFIYALPIRINGTAELAVITPSKDISTSKPAVLGLKGGFDAELFADPARSHALFLGAGGLGLFQPYFADNLAGNPTVANGFTAAVGYRYYF